MNSIKRKDSKGRILKDGENQMKDGRYRYQYIDSQGKRRAIYSWKLVKSDRIPTGKRDDICLREKIKQIKKDQIDGIKPASENNITLNDMFYLYMAGKHELKQSTRTNYLYMYRNYVSPHLGTRKIADIKYSDIKLFYNNLIYEKGFRPNSLEIIHTIIHPVFTMAVRDNYIRNNPAYGVMSEIKKNYKWEKPKRHALSIEEQEAFINYISKSEIYRNWLPLFTIFLGTGCRVGEIIGLRWQDCDFDNKTIHINHHLIYRQQENGHCEMHVTTPKTSSGVRTIPMLDEVKDALLQEKQNQVSRGGCKVVIDGYSNFVFTNRHGNVHNPQTINRIIKRICKKYNEQEKQKAQKYHYDPVLIRHFSVHNLRHTFCSRFCENENNVKVIQEIMGHSDISTTMNIYAEVTEQKKKQSFANLQGKIKIS